MTLLSHVPPRPVYVTPYRNINGIRTNGTTSKVSDRSIKMAVSNKFLLKIVRIQEKL